MGRFSTPQQYGHWLTLRPRTLRTVQRQALADPAKTGQAASRAFDKGECNGVWDCGSAELAEVTIRKAPAVLQMLQQLCCGSENLPMSLKFSDLYT